MKQAQIIFLEEIAANAWPPLRVQHLAEWRLRYSDGVHSRANSVLPNGDDGRLSLDERLTMVEAFYKRLDLPARYQISPAAQPANLDAVLEERGYKLYEPVQVQTAVIDRFLSVHLFSQTKTTVRTTIHTALPDAWLAFDNRVAQHSLHRAQVRSQILRQIAPQTAFATAYLEGQIAGIGLGVYERGWLGIFNMLTAPLQRKKGVGTAVLNALAHWAKQQGADHAYLQVVAANIAAQALYRRVGFTYHHSYHYRQQPT
ncbi:MAG: GNAT family N-acetyltransferase [Chloroflexota bacterium]